MKLFIIAAISLCAATVFAQQRQPEAKPGMVLQANIPAPVPVQESVVMTASGKSEHAPAAKSAKPTPLTLPAGVEAPATNKVQHADGVETKLEGTPAPRTIWKSGLAVPVPIERSAASEPKKPVESR